MGIKAVERIKAQVFGDAHTNSESFVALIAKLIIFIGLELFHGFPFGPCLNGNFVGFEFFDLGDQFFQLRFFWLFEHIHFLFFSSFMGVQTRVLKMKGANDQYLRSVRRVKIGGSFNGI